MTREPASADPADVARKQAAAPGLRTPPAPVWVLNDEGRVIDYKMQGMTRGRKIRNRLGELIFNSFITFIPSHTIRQGFLRLMGAKIGKNSSILRGTTVLDIEFLTIGDGVAIGFRCLLDSRAGLYIGNNVTVASDVHFIGGGHDINHPDFLPVPIPTVVCDYVWIASRAMVLPSLIGRGAVVAAHALVNKDVGELEIVGGVPAKVIGKRDADALKYENKHRPLFY
ncbi:acyltransferase [Mycolicibacterium cosmeticum]|uniref:Colanic acid biosynthesis acetyltransferase WcaF n=1 Tax=Mycolicibacterium cosmeticum TaxID=258533 RepID=W9AX52_MYCCO|nr:acyltransferase [Mycolicibacterium cosmeticum]TLH81734.1 acyltransferase [Mycolicibacterium cosmeticum]CDO10088.1 colanic acid biosynthesis acetyltransferase WcaF [Mycolicibacterium cosmeticum]